VEVLLNAVGEPYGELARSIDFYTAVFSFPLVTRREQLAVLQISQANRSQAPVLRDNRRAAHPGGGNVGINDIGFEVASPEEVVLVEKRLAERDACVRRLRRDSSETVFGVDPDRNAIAFTAGLTGGPTQMAEWSDPDEILEAIAQ
jgi:catechol 2,3-dioxygenase-like lactoylglutathione lyase family enzyme